MSLNREIPIKLGDFSVIDTEFSNIRERFDAEMRKMEEEMSKFRSELMNRESKFLQELHQHDDVFVDEQHKWNRSRTQTERIKNMVRRNQLTINPTRWKREES